MKNFAHFFPVVRLAFAVVLLTALAALVAPAQATLQPLQLALTAPTNQTSYVSAQNALVLRGTASSPSPIQRIGWRVLQTSLNGTATGTDTWEINNVWLRLGLNTIVITAQDFSGRTATYTLNVTYEMPATAPEIIVQSPGANSILPLNSFPKVAWAVAGNIPADWPTSGGLPVVAIDLERNGVRIATLAEAVSSVSNTLLNLGGYPEGSGYQFRVMSRDANGGKGLYAGLSAPFSISASGAPIISAFTVTGQNKPTGISASVTVGEDFALRWTLAGGVMQQLQLAVSGTSGSESLLGRDTKIVRAMQPGLYTYTLTASNNVGSVSEIVSVEILPASNAPSATETLYNGITLPTNWPPKPADYLDTAVLPSYLSNPPPVIPINVGRQLLVDDFLIESSTLTRQFHPATFHETNPVLKPATAIEKSPQGPFAAPFSSGVFYDPAEKLFKMWYECGYRVNICYATSSDGISWVRPNLDVVPGTNVVYRDNRLVDGYTVWLDLAETNPARRYKMMRVISETGLEFNIHYSSDGIHWGPTVVVNKIMPGDRSTFFYNPFRQRWGLSLRNFVTPGGRVRHYQEHKDLAFALASIVKANASPAETLVQSLGKWVKSDALDMPHPNDPTAVPELYNLDVSPYESLLLGQFSILRGRSGLPSGRPKLNQVYFGFSRDGFQWHRPNRQPMFATAEQAGAWNWGNVQSTAGGPLIVGDQMYFYFSGRSGSSVNIDAGGATGLAIMRRDGFASLNADATEGSVTTRLLSFQGQHLFVNADVASDGALCAEILDANNQVIAPFSRENCLAFTGNQTKQMLGWQGAANLSALSGQNIKLRFYLLKGKLYSFWISPSPTGISMGYVGAGGPAFTSHRDDNAQPPNPVQVGLSPAVQTIVTGQTVTLTYNLNNAETAQLTPAIAGCEINPAVSLSGTCTFTAAEPGLYSWRLQATNGGQTATTYAQVTVIEPVPLPVINSFTASSTQIQAGQTITLSWALGGGAAESVRLDPTVGVVTAGNFVTVTPTALSTTYVLTVSNLGGTVSRAVTVTVIPDTTPPQVTVTAPTATYWPSGTPPITVEVTTNENATCRIGSLANVGDFNALELFTLTGARAHRTVIGTQDNNSYAYAIRCADSSGNLSTGTTLNWRVAAANESVNHSALQLDGLSGYLKPSARTNVATRQWTLEAWFRTSAVTTQYQTILGNQSGSDLRLTPGTNAKILVSLYLGGHNNFFGTRRVNDGNWHHVVAVRDIDKLYVYLDGTVEIENNSRLPYLPLTGSTNNTNLNLVAIGNRGTASEWFNGAVDDVRVYNRALSASEALAHYNYGQSIPSIGESGLWMGFDFNETSGLAFDFSGNNTLGTLTGAANRIARVYAPPPDLTPPTVTIEAPALRTFPAHTSEITLQVRTNENATCKYTNTGNVLFAAMGNAFANSGAQLHSVNFEKLQAGQTYNYHLSCADSAGNASAPLAFSFNLEAPPPPSIESFTITDGTQPPGNAITIDVAQPATLAWATTNALSANLTGTNCAVSPLAAGSCTFTPTQAGTFTLTLTVQAGTNTATASVTVTAIQPPDTLAPGLTITQPLSLTTESASLALAGTATDNVAVTAVTFATDRGHQGNATGTNTWAATIPLEIGSNTINVQAVDAANNATTASIVITRHEPLPPTVSLTADLATVIAGQPVLLSFGSSHATQVTVTPALQGCALSPNTNAQCAAHPAETTTYTFTATNSLGQTASASVTVTVQPLLTAPIISSFGATPMQIIAGQSTTLSWQLTGGIPETLSLNQNIGSVLGQSQLSVTPTQTTTYQLTASNAAGSVTLTIIIHVIEPDLTPPQLTLTNPLPNEFPAGTAQVTLGLNTNEIAACRFAMSSELAFESMTLLSNTNAQAHSHLFATQNGQSYSLFLRCADAQGNVSALLPVSFSISNPPPAVNRALQVDGVTGYVNFPTRSNLNTLKWTLSVWIKTAESITSYQTVIGNHSGNEVRLFGGANGRVLITAYAGGFVNYFGRRKINDGNWHHIVAVRDQNRLYLYVDGLVDNDSETGLPYKNIPNGTTNSIFNLRALGNRGTAAEWYKGMMDDVRGYIRALTGQEITAQYNNGAGVALTPENGMVFGYNFDEALGDVLDVSASQRHGQLVGGATRVVR